MYQKRIKNVLSSALDFLFPSSESITKFERSSAEDLLRLLPTSEPFSQPVNISNLEITTLFKYQDERVKHLVWEIKYYRNQKLTDSIGVLLAGKIKQKFQNQTEKCFLVPIPLTGRRLRERGYNHTELLANSTLKNLPENFGLASPEFLKKIRHTPKQHSIENRADRFTNIVGAFAVPSPQLVVGQNIIIVDDVITTGATVAEAQKALVLAGAKSVRVIAVAH